MEPIVLSPIGVVRTARVSSETTPIQAALNPDEVGTVELAGGMDEGLAGLAGFDHAWLLVWLDRPREPGPAPLVQVPFLARAEQRRVGVFAMRGPHRPNPIGLSLVRVLGVTGSTVRFGGVDILDGTPVLDLKPYVARFDRPPGEPRCGWFDEVAIRDGVTPADLGSPPPG